MEDYGYVVRKDQPLVYERKVTLKDELDCIAKSEIQLRSITPGFQVWQGISDVRNGENVLIIGSHLPGLTRKYVNDDIVRQDLQDKSRTIHALSLKFMKRKIIKVVELEPEIDNGKKKVHSGPPWPEETKEMERQMKENFALAEQGKVDMSKGPFYLS